MTYLRQYNESYRGIDFIIIQRTDQDWMVQLTTERLIQKFDTYREAFTYSKGYIDGCLEHLSEWSDDE